jgi:hypothetical protein
MCLSGATYLPAHFVVLCGHDNRKDSECQMEQCIVGMTDLKIVIVSNGTVLCGHDRLKDSDSVKWNSALKHYSI